MYSKIKLRPFDWDVNSWLGVFCKNLCQNRKMRKIQTKIKSIKLIQTRDFCKRFSFRHTIYFHYALVFPFYHRAVFLEWIQAIVHLSPAFYFHTLWHAVGSVVLIYTSAAGNGRNQNIHGREKFVLAGKKQLCCMWRFTLYGFSTAVLPCCLWSSACVWSIFFCDEHERLLCKKAGKGSDPRAVHPSCDAVCRRFCLPFWLYSLLTLRRRADDSARENELQHVNTV